MRRSLLVLLLLCAAVRAFAQGTEGAPRIAAARPDSSRTSSALISRHELLVAGTVTLAAAAVMPFDVRVADAVRAPGQQGSAFLRGGTTAANAAGDPGTLLASAALYGAGRALGQPRVAALGVHAAEAVVIAGTSTALLKVMAGRQRPNVEAMDADDYAPAHGFRAGRTSLPSGHTAAAFAFASAVSGDLRQWRPDVARVASPLLYAGATTVGLARMYSHKHWASDVMLGAVVGTLAGRGVASYAHAHPNNWLDRHLGAVSVAPAADGRGLAIGVHGTVR